MISTILRSASLRIGGRPGNRERLLLPVASAVIIAMLALTPSRAWSVVVDVFPGPGTPLQMAIDAAAPGTTLRLHPGGFAEAVVIDKPLRLTRFPNVSSVTLDGSATGAQVVLDIAADGVRIEGGAVANNNRAIFVSGNAQQTAVRVNANSGVILKNIRAASSVFTMPFRIHEGLALDGTTGVTVEGFVTTAADTGLRISNVPAGSHVKLSRSKFDFDGTDRVGVSWRARARDQAVAQAGSSCVGFSCSDNRVSS